MVAPGGLDRIGPGGLLATTSERIRRAPKFVLDHYFAQAADELSTRKGDLIKILPFCRLPFPECWFEVAANDRVSFLAGGALPTDGRPSRVGFLVSENAECSWKAHLFWNFAADTPPTIFGEVNHLTAVSGFAMTFDFGVAAKTEMVPSLIFSEATTCIVDADFLPGAPPTFKLLSQQISDWRGEGAFLLALLALLNTKNVCVLENVDRSKQNRGRKRRGRCPFFDYHLLRVDDRLKAKTGCSGRLESEGFRAHFVRGHFKVRKTGVFFWSPFVRGDLGKGFANKDYKLSRITKVSSGEAGGMSGRQD